MANPEIGIDGRKIEDPRVTRRNCLIAIGAVIAALAVGSTVLVPKEGDTTIVDFVRKAFKVGEKSSLVEGVYWALTNTNIP